MPAYLPSRSSALPARVVGAGVACWLIFGLAWWRVVETHSTVSARTLWVLLGCATAVVAVDLWWVQHNRRIYRAKGPRRGRPHASSPLVADSLGRPLLISDKARQSPEVVVTVTATGVKSYRAAGQSR